MREGRTFYPWCAQLRDTVFYIFVEKDKTKQLMKITLLKHLNRGTAQFSKTES